MANSIYISGLASGLDTDGMIQAMLMGQQNKIDTAENDKKMAEWKKETWSDVNKQLNDFYSNYVDKLSRESTFQGYKTTSSSDAVSTNGTSTTAGTHVFTDIKMAEEASATGELNYLISSKTETFGNMGLLSSGQSTSFTVYSKDENGKEIETKVEITADDTLNTLKKKLEAADSNLSINFDLKNSKTFISSKNTGEDASLKMTFEGDDNLFRRLGLTSLVDKEGQKVDITEGLKGTNATYKYNGVAYTSQSNDVEINGVKVSFDRNTKEGEKVTVKVKSDSDKVVDFMKEFVDKYNELTESLNKKYSATKAVTTPLTDSQRSTMTDKEIDEYEQNIKDSLLRRDSSLQSVISTLRNTLQTTFSDGKYKSLSAVGITTGNYTENGKLHFDEEKFRKAYEDSPEDVMKLFTATDDAVKKGDKKASESKSMGIGTKLQDSFKTMQKRIDGVKSYQSYYNDKLADNEIKNYSKKITELYKKYTTLEARYRKQFAAMESAMSAINNQSSNLAGLLG